jgi:23S rRNA (pseudouridine1915-N3)-methyltransferase
MKNITIIAVGPAKDKNFKLLGENYLKRLLPYVSIDIREVKAFSFSENNKAKAKRSDEEEISRALRKIKDSIIIVLDEKGKRMESEAFADFIEKENKNLVFVIGGALGFSEGFKDKFTRLSLSVMTFPHEMARVILLEQIYRAMTIIKGKEYHY